MTYLGEVLREQAGGEWEILSGEATVGSTRSGGPYLRRSDEDGESVVSRPYSTVEYLVESRKLGLCTKGLARYSD